jgi:cellulose synthase/poly-beta-1,6-N-acetylglucosamine synthase-like glycosyltransferase
MVEKKKIECIYRYRITCYLFSVNIKSRKQTIVQVRARNTTSCLIEIWLWDDGDRITGELLNIVYIKSINFKIAPQLLKVTIGIPTFNEEQNILTFLRRLETDTSNNYPISEIIISDDSSDNTPKIIEEYTKNSSMNVRFIHHHERRGAVAAWNEIFEESTGDIIILYDADIILGQNCTHELVSKIQGKIGLCTSNQKPIQVRGLIGRASIFIAKWLESIRNRGLSQYTVMGRALSIYSDLAKKISIPNDIIAIDLYLQCKVIEHGFDIFYNQNALIYFYPANNMSDFISQVLRASNGHRQIRKYLKRFKVCLSSNVALIETIRNIYNDPSGALSLFACYTLIPFYIFKLKGINSSKWYTAKSTKSIGYE